jgi:hypothetical protein
MFDLRFVEREVPDWPADIIYGEPYKMKVVKILQYRYCEPCSSLTDYFDDFTAWSEWEDVPTETGE